MADIKTHPSLSNPKHKVWRLSIGGFVIKKEFGLNDIIIRRNLVILFSVALQSAIQDVVVRTLRVCHSS